MSVLMEMSKCVICSNVRNSFWARNYVMCFCHCLKSFYKMNAVVLAVEERISIYLPVHAHIHTKPFYGCLDFVLDNLSELVPEETFTHSTIMVINHPLICTQVQKRF